MQKLLNILTLAIAMAGSAIGAEIAPEDAKNHIGEIVTVKGVVTQVFVSKTTNVFLNFGGKYPNQMFSADVLIKKAPKLVSEGIEWLTAMEGKEVAVSGKITIYKGKPEIILSERGEIKVTSE